MTEITIDPAALHHRFSLQLAGTSCAVATNYSALRDTLGAWEKSGSGVAGSFAMHVVVAGSRKQPSGIPRFRGLHHLVIANFGLQDIFVFDLLRRTVTATISESTAKGREFWNHVLLPIAMGVLGAAVGVVPVHCACLSLDGEAILIAGASGAGKSTLSLALVEHGFDYISDDWTYLSCQEDMLTAHGMSAPLKLLPDAVKHFPSLAKYPLRTALNGELAYSLTASDAHASVRLCCEPRYFVFLTRSNNEGCSFSPVSPQEALYYVESSVEPLPSELDHISRQRAELINQVSRLSCWTLCYGGAPQLAAAAVSQFISRRRLGISA